MKRPMAIVWKNCWFGLVYTLASLLGAALYTWQFGRLWGRLNVAALAFAILVIGVMGVAGVVAFFRTPNPYTRTYALYNLDEVPEQLRGKLDSGGSGWLWQVAPMALTALILLPFFA